MQKTLKVGSRITLQDQLQLMMQIELLNVVFMMNTISGQSTFWFQKALHHRELR